MAFFNLDKKLCKRDNICFKLCPAGIIELDENKYPYISDINTPRCIKCGQCVSFCPYGACGVESVPDTLDIDANLIPKPNQAEMFLRSRRSIRMFRQDRLPREEIEKLLKTAESAPTAANTRALRWIVIDEKEKLHTAGSMVADYFKNEAERIKQDMPDYSKFMKALAAAYERGTDVFFRGAPQLIAVAAPADYDWKMEDSIAALTYLELAAHGHGAGMTWAGYFLTAARNYKPLKEYLGLSEAEYLCGAQMTGYPVLGIAKKAPVKTAYKINYI